MHRHGSRWRGRHEASGHAGCGRVARPLAQDAGALPRERRGTCLPTLRRLDALPARRHRGVDHGVTEGVHVRGERRPKEEGAVGKPLHSYARRCGAGDRGETEGDAATSRARNAGNGEGSNYVRDENMKNRFRTVSYQIDKSPYARL